MAHSKSMEDEVFKSFLIEQQLRSGAGGTSLDVDAEEWKKVFSALSEDDQMATRPVNQLGNQNSTIGAVPQSSTAKTPTTSTTSLPTSTSPTSEPLSLVLPTMLPGDTKLGTWLSLGSYEEVYNSDWDYWTVLNELKKTNMTMLKILRIRNEHLKEQFEEEQQLVTKKNPGIDPNIQFLYHGTASSLEMVCQDGFDERLATPGHYGRGIYFSDNPSFCRNEAESVPSKFAPFIFRCKVILGDCKDYGNSSDPSLTREPVKENMNRKKTFYDSVKGKPGDFTQYVIYEKRRAVVQYLIFYSTTLPRPKIPEIPKVSKTKRNANKIDQSRANNDTANRASMSSLTDQRGKKSEHDSDTDSPASGSIASGNSSRRSSIRSVESKNSSRRSSVSSTDGACGLDDSSKIGSQDKSSTCEQKQSDCTATTTKETSTVPHVRSVRNRTTKLMSASGGGASIGASAAEASGGATATSPPTPHSDIYKQKIQADALRQLLQLKGKVGQREMDELVRCYNRTYGTSTTAGGLGSNDTELPVEQICYQLIENFKNVVGTGLSTSEARRYIMDNGMDLNVATNAYFADRFGD